MNGVFTQLSKKEGLNMNHVKLVDKFQLATGALIFLAAGCSVGPNYEKPDLSVPAAWTEAQQKGVDTRSVDLAKWWSEFNDPLLNSLVERAVRSNLDLRLAEARIREARASRVVTAAGAWPTVDVSGSYTRNRSSENAFGVPTQGAVITPPGGINLDQNLYRTGFDANWEIDVFGGVRRSVEAADATIDATVEDRRDVLVTLLGEVAKNYIDLRGFSASSR
jgi:outer membrane protein, multidrug efflux system